MKYKKKASVLLMSLFLLGSGAANAELIIVDGSKTSVAPKGVANVSNVISSNNTSNLIIETGNNRTPHYVDGWGTQMKLPLVINQIMPDGWKYKTSIDLSKDVSWKASKENWISVLGRLANENNFKANVDWNTKTVLISENDAVFSAPQTKVTLVSSQAVNLQNVKPIKEATTETIVLNKTVSPVVVQAPAIVKPKSNKKFYMSKDKTLRENIEAWAKREGWTVSWEAPDYKIISGFTLTGEIDAEDGPIAKIVNSYESSEQPITAKILKGNKVIRIESRNFNQSTVISTFIGEEYK